MVEAVTEDRIVRRKMRKDGTTRNYFDESKFRAEIVPHLSDPSFVPPDSFVQDVFAITDGMINAEFGGNTFVLENREEMKQECFYEVLKSLRKFNAKKGRSFAYFNRIIKNTLLKHYYKSLRVASKEVKVFDLASNYDNKEDYTDDDLFGGIADPHDKDKENKHNSGLFAPFFDSDRSKINSVLKKNQETFDIEIALLQYLVSVNCIIKSVLHKQALFKKVVSAICFDETCTFISDFDPKDTKQLLTEALDLFSDCISRINQNIELHPENYLIIKKSSVLINNRVLLYYKNTISDRKIRKPYEVLTRNPRASAEILKIMLETCKKD